MVTELGTNWYVETKDRVKALRKALGLTQEAVGERAGYGDNARVYVSKIERGDNQVSTVKARTQLARGFGLSPDDLAAYLEGYLSMEDAAELARGGKPTAPKPIAPELVVVREPTGPAVPGEVLSAFEETLLALLRADDRFTFADSDAVRALFPIGAPLMRVGVDLVDTVRGWALAARRLRLDGKSTDPTSVMGLASMTGKGALAEQAAAKHDAEIQQHAKDKATERGYAPIKPLSAEKQNALKKHHSKPRGDDEPEGD